MPPNGLRVLKPGDSKKLSLKPKRSQRTEVSTCKVVNIMKSESDEVKPSSKQIQAKETDMVAQAKDNFSPVI